MRLSIVLTSRTQHPAPPRREGCPAARTAWIALALLALGAATGAAPAAVAEPGVQAAVLEEAVSEPIGIAGRVIASSSPLPSATVYAFQLTDGSHRRVLTDGEGAFLFDELPAGLYKIIAHKPGFVPVVLRLTRATAEAYQFLELQLAEVRREPTRPADDFWAVQAEIPPDVLRDMAIDEIEADARLAHIRHVPPGASFQTALQVESGVDEIAGGGSSQVTGGKVGIEGRMGQMKVGLSGDFLQLVPTDELRADARRDAIDGKANALSFVLASGERTRVGLTSQSNRLDRPAGEAGSFDFEQHQISLSHAMGTRSRSQLIAQYTSESHFYSHGRIEPAVIPQASESWRVEGSYETTFSDRSSLEAGFRYHQLDAVGGFESPSPLLTGLPDERVDLYGRGGLKMQPKVLLQYGLYTTLRDGTLSLIPQGGVVLQLAPTWQASVLASRRIDDSSSVATTGFVPAYFAETGSCEHNEEQCYQVVFTHQSNEEESISFGATHREYGEVERIYFDEGFFNRLESLYLVPGDRVPELQLGITRRLSPTVITHLESSVASGGGGIFRTAELAPYENEVSYLVTSLDTRFQATSTGLFLAFHQLRQELDAFSDDAAQVPEIEVERLQMVVTQDLDFLRDLAADWTLKLDMELSRGASPYLTDLPEDDVRKRLLGGISVSF